MKNLNFEKKKKFEIFKENLLFFFSNHTHSERDDNLIATNNTANNANKPKPTPKPRRNDESDAETWSITPSTTI